MPDLLTLPFAQRALLEVVLLAVAAGLVGTWVVLRGLAFLAHAVGTATFPGLVVADGLGFAAVLGAAGTGGACAAGVAWAARRGGERHDAHTALALVAAVAAGVVLASDVFRSQASVESLLFGSLLLVDDGDLVLAGAASAIAALATLTLGPRWLAVGFDGTSARALGARPRLTDALLVALVALLALAALTTLGALLVPALVVVPAATTRLVCRRLATWQVATVGLVVAEGVAGVWLALELDTPPGATIAALGASVFVLVALGRALRSPGRGRHAAVGAAAVVAAVGAAGCGSGGDDDPGAGRLQVVATTTQMGDLVREVGGDRVEVVQLLEPNSDPHDHEPRPSDVRAVAEAKLVVASGDGLDGWVQEVVDRSGSTARVLDAGKGRPVVLEPGEEARHDHGAEDEHAGEEAHDHGDTDPHWWHDPRNVVAATARIARALGDAAPAGRAAFDAAARRYVERTRRTDRTVAACFARIPHDDRQLVTDHDAFAYFAHRYDLHVVGAVIPSTTTQAQASAGDLAELRRTIRHEGVRVVFPESSLNPQLARTVARAAGARIGDALYADTLGPAGSPGATVLGALQANADRLVRGLTDGRQGCPSRS